MRGVYLNQKNELIEDQKSWDESDKSKNFDFSGYELWITTDNGSEPVGFDSFDDVKKYLIEDVGWTDTGVETLFSEFLHR